MDDLDVLARDFGFGNRGKANPMKPSTTDRRPVDSSLFSDVFSGQPKYTTTSTSRNAANPTLGTDFDYDSIFNSSSGSESKNSKSSVKSSLPVFDKPIYDDDIFDGLPGLKSKPASSSIRFDDDFFVSTSRTAKSENHDAGFDDLLGNLGRNEKAEEKNYSSGVKFDSSQGFDDLLAGFGGQNSHDSNRPTSESHWSSMPTVGSKKKNALDDPFVVLETSSAPHSSSQAATNPLEDIDKFSKSQSVKADISSGTGGAFDDLDPLSTLGKSSRRDNAGNNGAHRSSSAHFEKLGDNVPLDNFSETSFSSTPRDSANLKKNIQTSSSSQNHGTAAKAYAASTSDIGADQFEDLWITVSEIPLFTQPSTAPPPSRPPPPIPRKEPLPDSGSFGSSSRRKGSEFSSPPKYPESTQISKTTKEPSLSQFDELDDFAMGRAQRGFDDNAHASDKSMYSAAAASAAAMKDAMDKAEAKFRHAKEVRERESAKATRKEFFPLEKGELDEEEKEFREKQEKLDSERKQKEEEEGERQRLENERRKEIEKEKGRQAVERATREARGRAAVEARIKAERAAVEKANTDARERAERAAVQRAQAEARERAAAEAKERAAADAREREEREKIEARRRAERAAVERATEEARKRAALEARDRAAAEAREKAAAAAKMNQEKNDNDLESFFNSGRASSAPKARASPSDPFFEQQFPSKGVPESTRGAPSSGGSYSSMKKVSSSTNIVDDLSAIFGAAPSYGEFQEVQGETEERKRARMERHQRTQERAAKALAEKNQRDIQAQKEQEERHRYAEMLDVEIKRWAAGKEGNLRALLSTLQYVLWPESGWQPVSLTDLITGASVKKIYRKATLCIHPDKVQQKGATLQQKYIAEKVFDLLKEAWNKFNSEELF